MSSTLLLLLFLVPTQSHFPNLDARATQTIHPARRNMTVKAVALVKPAVIHIVAVKSQRVSPFAMFGNPQPKAARVQGTGVIFDKRGYAVTNQHVVAGSSSITVTLSNKRSYAAKIIGADKKLDIAVLKINAGHPLPVALLGTSQDLMPGETVVAIGSPHGFSFTISKGVISATHRNVLIKSRVYGDAIQTDAAINPGNSGGPLINILGEVIGINSFKRNNASSMGFAIPIDKVRTVARELLIHKKVRAIYLGMTVREGGNKIVVTHVEPNSPIARGGIRVGDVLQRIKNYKIGDLKDFGIIISTLVVGERVRFRTASGTKLVVVGQLSPKQAYSRFVTFLGIRLKSTRWGLAIDQISPVGRAYRMGLRVGDILKKINNKNLLTRKHLAKLLLGLRSTKSLYTIVTRRGYDYPLIINY